MDIKVRHGATEVSNMYIVTNFSVLLECDVFNQVVKPKLFELFHSLYHFVVSVKDQPPSEASRNTKVTFRKLTVGDAFIIHVMRWSKEYKVNKRKYDTSLLLFIAWIVAEIKCEAQHFDFEDFVKHEIRGEQRKSTCIHGDCFIETESGARKARDIRAGDLVQLSDGSLVKVECALTQRIENQMEMCLIGQCWVTIEHPVRINDGEWVLPKDVVTPKTMFVDQVNNFVLESGHHVVVDGVECITLGHCMDEPQQLYHPVWGTDVIRDFLKTLPGYPNVEITAVSLRKLLQMQYDQDIAL